MSGTIKDGHTSDPCLEPAEKAGRGQGRQAAGDGDVCGRCAEVGVGHGLAAD